MSGLLKNLLFALGLVVILWVGYTVFLEEEDALTVQSGSLSGEAERSTQDFLALLNQLRGIKFEETFFENPTFRSLQDFRKSIESEPVGRVNPFDPAQVVPPAQQ